MIFFIILGCQHETCNKICNGVESWGGGSTAVQLINHNGLTGILKSFGIPICPCPLGGLCTAIFCNRQEIDGPGYGMQPTSSCIPQVCGNREVRGYAAPCFHDRPEECLPLTQQVLPEMLMGGCALEICLRKI